MLQIQLKSLTLQNHRYNLTMRSLFRPQYKQHPLEGIIPVNAQTNFYKTNLDTYLTLR